MKHLKLIMLLASLLAMSACRQASVPTPPDDWALQQQKKRVTELESQLGDLRHVNDRWQTLCAFIGVGAVVLLILGTALGAKTRHDALTTP